MFVRIYQKTRISIHAPTRGATVATSRVKGCSADFNPRSHEGSDLVEIRARRCVYRFQSTLPRGERQCNGLEQQIKELFQSTLPRGERPSAERLGGVLWDFNPRSHEGSDLLWSGYRTKLRDISIHAPTRGATSISSVTDPVFIISIHAPTRGATALPCL